MWPRSAVSGVRSSWETVATNSSFIRSIARRSVTSRAMTTKARPAVGRHGAHGQLDGEARAVLAHALEFRASRPPPGRGRAQLQAGQDDGDGSSVEGADRMAE